MEFSKKLDDIEDRLTLLDVQSDVLFDMLVTVISSLEQRDRNAVLQDWLRFRSEHLRLRLDAMTSEAP